MIGYDETLTAATIRDDQSIGRMWLRGKDRAALLHRLSTNDIERLRPGQGARTALLTPIGRTIDLLTVYALDDALLLLTSPGQGAAVFGLLKRNIFFNDQVTIEPAARSHALLTLYGPLAAAILRAEIRPDLHHHWAHELAGQSVLAAQTLGLHGGAFNLLIPADGLAAARGALAEAGATPLDDAAYDALQVEMGYGAFGRELSQEYIPLETGLLDAISFTKGCYVGQEIIARMESRGRLAKLLRGVRFDGELPEPGPILMDGANAGQLTSVVVSPRFGPIGLGYIKTALAEPGGPVAVGGVAGTIVELPFG